MPAASRDLAFTCLFALLLAGACASPGPEPTARQPTPSATGEATTASAPATTATERPAPSPTETPLPTLRGCQKPSPHAPSALELAYVADEGEVRRIYTIHADGSARAPFQSPRASTWSPLFSPDGRWMAYYSGSMPGIRLYIRSLSTGDDLAITPGRDLFADKAWSPDGTKLAYYLLDGLIYVYDPESRMSREVTEGEKLAWFVRDWSPDGQTLLLVALPYQPYSFVARIAMVRLDGGIKRVWVEHPFEDAYSPDWLPSQDRILLLAAPPDSVT